MYTPNLIVWVFPVIETSTLARKFRPFFIKSKMPYATERAHFESCSGKFRQYSRPKRAPTDDSMSGNTALTMAVVHDSKLDTDGCFWNGCFGQESQAGLDFAVLTILRPRVCCLKVRNYLWKKRPTNHRFCLEFWGGRTFFDEGAVERTFGEV